MGGGEREGGWEREVGDGRVGEPAGGDGRREQERERERIDGRRRGRDRWGEREGGRQREG